MSTWLFILLFGYTGAQVIEMPSQQACLELKTFADSKVNQDPELKDKVVSGCFKNLGGHAKES